MVKGTITYDNNDGTFQEVNTKLYKDEQEATFKMKRLIETYALDDAEQSLIADDIEYTDDELEQQAAIESENYHYRIEPLN